MTHCVLGRRRITHLVLVLLLVAGCAPSITSATRSAQGSDPYRVQANHGCPAAEEISAIVKDTVQLTTQDNDPIVCTYEQPATDVFGTVRFAFTAGMSLEAYIESAHKMAPKARFPSVTINGVKGIRVGDGVAMPWGGGMMEVSASGFDHAGKSDAELTRIVAERYGEKILQDMKQ